MSPASGDFPSSVGSHKGLLLAGFHSINVPSEWGQLRTEASYAQPRGFHSINVPSEWGLASLFPSRVNSFFVSIQLMSPASGDLKQLRNNHDYTIGTFPFN